MKTVEVIGRFPEVEIDGYAVEVTATETASTLKASVSRAIGTILKNPSLKRKRVQTITFNVQVVEK